MNDPYTVPQVTDRLAPRDKPSGPVVMLQEWHDLLFLHWRVSAAEIQRRLPPGLSVDTFGGDAYIGVVPFQMRRVRPPGLPPFHPLSDIGEINVRTYVHANGRDPGVWFFSLDATSAIAVLGARALYKLPYYLARITQSPQPEEHLSDPAPIIRYHSRRIGPGPVPAMCDVTYTPHGNAYEASPGTLDYFLLERYILYAAHGNRLYSARVHHAPYPIESATVHRLSENLVRAGGITHGFEEPLAHYARAVYPQIFPLVRL